MVTRCFGCRIVADGGESGSADSRLSPPGRRNGVEAAAWRASAERAPRKALLGVLAGVAVGVVGVLAAIGMGEAMDTEKGTAGPAAAAVVVVVVVVALSTCCCCP